MSVRIRLTRMGNRNNPFYRIVAANSQDPNNGKAIEYLGTYDPKSGGQTVLKKDRYEHWIGVGAIPSDTVRSLIPRAVDHATLRGNKKAAAPVEAAESEAPETAEAEQAPADSE